MVPEERAEEAKKDLAGYYAHCSALDNCIGELQKTIKDSFIEENTIFIFTSDHGDMLFSHGEQRKQRPWNESIRVPFLMKYPALKDKQIQNLDALIDAPDIMPTLLGLCNQPIPKSVEGTDFSDYIKLGENPSDNSALITCPHPFGEWINSGGGKEYRGLKTTRYTYVRDLKDPWLLYDNFEDPYQMNNLINSPEHKTVRDDLDRRLSKKLIEANDEFLPGMEYIKKWNYKVDKNGTVPYTD